jgi:Ni,Fe-hydrogenase I small subunit
VEIKNLHRKENTKITPTACPYCQTRETKLCITYDAKCYGCNQSLLLSAHPSSKRAKAMLDFIEITHGKEYRDNVAEQTRDKWRALG